MRFWDASAIVPLLVKEPSTRWLQELGREDPVLLVWWGAAVECASALARLDREGALSVRAMGVALDRLRTLLSAWHEIEPSEAVRETAIRLLRVHPLRAADALQLAAAFLAAEQRPASLDLATLDDRLASAAAREGFVVLNAPTAG